MSETTTPPEAPEAPDPADAPEAPIHDAPADIDADASTGYAVYNRTLGQYLPGVEKDKPSQSKADKRVPEGHVAAVVRV